MLVACGQFADRTKISSRLCISSALLRIPPKNNAQHSPSTARTCIVQGIILAALPRLARREKRKEKRPKKENHPAATMARGNQREKSREANLKKQQGQVCSFSWWNAAATSHETSERIAVVQRGASSSTPFYLLSLPIQQLLMESVNDLEKGHRQEWHRDAA